jgi:putative transposase
LYDGVVDLYHVLNRGVEKRTIFLDTQDYARFVHNLYEFNDTKPGWNAGRAFSAQMIDLEGQSSVRRYVKSERRGKRLVDIHAWVLMRNHYHMLLSEQIEGGISKFLMKVNVGYAKYFNEKYDRSGYVFQGRTKKVLIKRDGHFMHIVPYIHLNPLDYLKGAERWREGNIANASAALLHLDNYRWSSFRDYCGVKNFPSILTTSLFGEKNYRTTFLNYLKNLESGDLADVVLE